MNDTPTWLAPQGVPTSTQALANHIVAQGIRERGSEPAGWFIDCANHRPGQPVVRTVSTPTPFCG